MPEATASLLDQGTRVLRELALQQGLAYRTYGEVLQRFGERQIGWTELLKTSGDIYIREAAQAAWSLVRANANAYAWMLSAAGAKPASPDVGQERDVAPTVPPSGKRAQRGRG
jgi:hypothetical protein